MGSDSDYYDYIVSVNRVNFDPQSRQAMMLLLADAHTQVLAFQRSSAPSQNRDCNYIGFIHLGVADANNLAAAQWKPD